MINAAAARLLETQFGCISRQQLIRECGHTEGEVEGLVERGVLEVVYRGIYRIRGGASPPEQAPMGATLRCRDPSRVAGPFVFGLLGVGGFSLHDPFVALVRPDRRVSNVPFSVRRDRAVHLHRARYGPLPIVTPARNVVELAFDSTETEILDAVDAARWRRLLTADSLARCAAELAGWHAGAARVLDLLAREDVLVESSGERELLAEVLARLPVPVEAQAWLAPDIRVDFLVRPANVVLEYAGGLHHGGPGGRRRDRPRDEAIRSLGYEVVHISRRDLDDADALLARLLAVIAPRLAQYALR